MKHFALAAFLVAAGHVSGNANAQSMAIVWDLYVFPGGDQTIEQQYADERECHQRSREITGVDPANPMAGVRTERTDQGGEGLAAAGGAVQGATRAAIIGNIADEDAGEYALAGALIGSVRGARRREAQNQQAQVEARDAAAAEGEKRMATFKRAFTACMQSRDYTVS